MNGHQSRLLASILSPAVLLVYGVGLLQGLALVSAPALSAVFVRELGVTSAQYGSIFLPLVACTTVAAVAGGGLAKHLGLRRLLTAALLANAVSQLLLAASAAVPGSAYSLLLAAAAVFGLAFGLTGAPLNAYPPLLFPTQPQAAVVAVHTLIGLGLALGPLIVNAFVAAEAWFGYPLLLAVASVLAFALARFVTPPEATNGAGTARPTGPPPWRAAAFWLLAVIAMVYAFAEGTFANWAVIYLNEGKGLAASTAGLALSAFWAALVTGRLLVTILVTRVAAHTIWISLPILMIAVFLLLPYASTAATGIAMFAVAGLACSAFFPLTISLASQRFPDHVAWVSSMMIAALMIGVGIGTFLVGLLRDLLTFQELYRLSALYPLIAALLAAAVLRGRKALPRRPAPVTTA